MNERNDSDLLREYVTSGSDDAFATLVSRYVGLIYSSALRQVSDPFLAEEITQAVFIILARKAHRLKPGTILSGWLFQTTRFAAADALKLRSRRQKYEQEAAKMEPIETDRTWQQLAPILDEAISRLNAKDRDAVLLRFFEKKSLKEVGTALGLNDDAAQKCVARAVEKLRLFFRDRNVLLPAATLATLLASQTVQGAPAQTASSVLAAAATKGAAVSIVTSTIVRESLRMLTWIKLKPMVAFGCAVALGIGGIVLVAQRLSARQSPFEIRLVADVPGPNAHWMTNYTAQQAQVLSVQKSALLDHTAVKEASVQETVPGRPEISVTFTEEGTRRFAEITRTNIGRRLAIIINEEIYSAPMIRSGIPGGKCTITGNFTPQQATNLVTKINKSLRRGL